MTCSEKRSLVPMTMPKFFTLFFYRDILNSGFLNWDYLLEQVLLSHCKTKWLRTFEGWLNVCILEISKRRCKSLLILLFVSKTSSAWNVKYSRVSSAYKWQFCSTEGNLAVQIENSNAFCLVVLPSIVLMNLNTLRRILGAVIYRSEMMRQIYKLGQKIPHN